MASQVLARRSVISRLLGLTERLGESRLIVTVTGPGGSGKTSALEELGRALSASGVPVASLRDAPSGEDVAAVLIDDAHLLGPGELNEVAELVRSGESHVVLARRPWPQSPELRRLLASMNGSEIPVNLGALSPDEIADYAHRFLGRPLPPEALSKVVEQTGGLPWLVRRVVQAWETDARGLPDPLFPDSVRSQLGSEIVTFDGELVELLLDLAVGFDLTAHVPPPAIRHDHSGHLVARAKAEGLLDANSRPVPLITRAVLSELPSSRVREHQRTYLDALVVEGLTLDLPAARTMTSAGVRHPLLTRTLLLAADEFVLRRPAEALELYTDAARAGADEAETAVRRARALVFAGDLDGAARIVDDVMARTDESDTRLAVDIAAAIWAQRGMLLRSADVYRWLGSNRIGASGSLAAVTMLGTGDYAGAEEMLEVRSEESPTDLGVSLRLMAEGLRNTVAGSSARGLSMLLRASDTLNALRAAPPLPALPAVLAALASMHEADVAVAASVLDDALRAGQGGPAMRPELLLRRAWAAMLQDHLVQATSILSEARGHRLHGRELCLAAALEVGIARRAYDPAEILAAWRRARVHLHRWPLDLFMLQPLAELQMAAARVGESDRLAELLNDAWRLIDALGHPTLWSVPMHWSSIQAAILSDRPGDLRTHANALLKMSPGSRMASAMVPASRAWAALMARSFDAADVEAAATGLARVGMSWEGARLLSQAATRATDRRDQARLLAKAREIRPPAEAPGRAVATANEARGSDSSSPAVPPAREVREVPTASMLSDRERQVASMLVAGRTYREIGAALFMSPRTAEHHVARMRARLGAEDRNDLIIRLRAELGTDGGAS